MSFSFLAERRSRAHARLPLLTLLLLGPARAALPQEPVADLPLAPLEASAGGLELRFESSAIEVRSASTSTEHVGVPWRYELESYGRGSADQQVAPALPRRSKELVSYERGPVVETYELREDGVKQSFLFAERPAGEGELVVRGRVRSALAPVFASEHGVRFERAGCAGIALGAVIGIDAEGRRSEGSIRLHGEVLEYTLPAAFVDAARFPLLVDPLIGSSSMISNPGYDDISASVVGRGDSTEWLACFEAVLVPGGAASAIRGQRFTSSGSATGGLLTFQSTGQRPQEPASARVAGRDTNLVVWRMFDSSIGVRALVGATTLGPIEAVAPPSTPILRSGLALGGEALALAGDRAVATWAEHDSVSGASSIHLRRVQVDPAFQNGQLLFEPSQLVASIPSATSLLRGETSISRTGGRVGRWLIVWNEGRSNQTTPQRLCGRFFLRDGSFDGPEFVIEDNALTIAISSFAVDGDGENFLVAYNDGDAIARARCIRRTATGPYVTNSTTVYTGLTGAAVTSVAWMGSSVLIGASVSGAPTRSARLYSVDSYSGISCEGGFDLTGATQTRDLGVGSRFDGVNTTSRDAFLAWGGNSGSGYELFAQRFRTDSGLVQNLGGGCGSGGTALVSCSRSPVTAPHFLRLRGAAPSAMAYLALSRGSLGIACGGGCQLLADPFDGGVVGLLTDALGDTALNVPIGPGLVGQRFVFQWVSPGANCFGGFDLSNALQVTIQ